MLKRFAGPKIIDLMRLVENDEADFEAVIAKTYEWEHLRRLEVGKWLLATAAALVIGMLSLFAGGKVSEAQMWGIGAIAGAFGWIGLMTLWTARAVAARYTRTVALAARMAAIRNFLHLLRSQGHL